MKFGRKHSEIPEGEELGEFIPYLRNFREGDTTVRFIEEIDEWIEFYEHYTLEGKGFPCTGDRKSCPGCTSEVEKVAKASRKYATNLELVSNHAVLPFRIPASLSKKLFNRAERNGTITNRDYVIMREGKGLDTEYDVEQDDKYEVNLRELLGKSHDLQAILLGSYEEIWGPVNSKPMKQGPVKAVEEVQNEEPPFDDSEVEEATLRKMTKEELLDLADRHNITVDDRGSKMEILDTILETA